jgi:hypothetical protein
MKWIGQHIYDLVARFRNDVYLEDLSTTTETNVLVVDSTGKVSKTTVITGDVTGVTAGSNITVTDPTGPVPTVALSTNVDVAGTLDVTSLGTFDASVTVAGKISLKDAGDSIFVGYQAGLNDDASANRNVGVGYQALRTNTTGADNTAVGYQALYSNTTGASNSAHGLRALYFNTTGVNNTATGVYTLYSNTTGAYNTAVGRDTLYSNTTGADNTAHGYRALYSNTTGANNTAHGYQALYFNTTGTLNTATGTSALTHNTADSNTANGFGALYNNTTGANNSAFGRQALYLNTTGANNTAIGIFSSQKNTTGTGNAALGYAALYENTTGNNNTAIGREAGRFIADGTTANTSTSNSVFLGYNTKALATGQTNQIVIGDTAVGLGSNTAILGNSSITKTQLQGNVGIGTDSPSAKLHTVGSGLFSSASYVEVGVDQTDSGKISMGVTSTTADGFISVVNTGAGHVATDPSIKFLVNSSEKMRITSAGNVGIGTTSPASKLQVALGINELAILNNGANSSGIWGTNIGFLSQATQAQITTHASVPLVFHTGGTRNSMTKGSEWMRITTTGNVGIGTASPVSNLHVFEGSSGESFTNLYGLAVETSGTSNSYHAMQVATGVGTVFDITNAGNVGIGTATPGHKLHVVGDRVAHQNDTGGFYRYNAAGTFRAAFTDNNTTTQIYADGDGSNAAMTFNAGNVGIGTTSPQSKLHVQNYTTGESHQAKFKGGAVTIGDYSYISLSNGYSTEYNKEVRLAAVVESFASNKTGFAILTSPDSSGASGHERLRVTADGNVGIGTDSPQAKLHVADGALRTWTPIGGTTAIFESTAINRSFVTITGTDQAELWFGNASIQNKGRVRYEMVGNNMEFWTNAVERMVISGSGNVGIGTTSPQNKLDIVGSLGRGAPVTKTTDFTVAATENWLIMNGTATITITLPTASDWTGRELMIKNIAAYTVISASSNVKPIDTDTAATAILPATAGSWCTLVSDGTNWVTMMN